MISQESSPLNDGGESDILDHLNTDFSIYKEISTIHHNPYKLSKQQDVAIYYE